MWIDTASVVEERLCGGAVAAALKDAEEFVPRADGFAVLVGQDAGDLVEVSQVVDRPGGEELG